MMTRKIKITGMSELEVLTVFPEAGFNISLHKKSS